jgi:hypothetical protein
MFLICSHGVDSEVSRQVIPTSPTSIQPTVELRPPEIVLTKIIPPMTTQIFDFSAPTISPAKSIVVSKADTVESFEAKIRAHLDLLSASQIRCFKFPVQRTDNIGSEMNTSKAVRMFPDQNDSLDFSVKSRTVGEIGIVEPYVGIAVEWKESGNTWPMEEASSSSEQSSVQDVAFPPGGGRTLGSAPNSFTALNRPRRSSNEKSLFESDDDDSPLGKINGQAISGPVLPGSYPRTVSPTNSYIRSSSAERYSDRYKTFNSRFSSQPPKEDRIRGTTGLNNLGSVPSLPPYLFQEIHVI